MAIGADWNGGMMRWLISILAVVGLAGVLPLSTPAPAYACSCAYAPDGPQIIEHVSRAASVFTGTATAERIYDQTAFYEFEVREVFKGDIGTTTTVSSSVQGPACGRSFEVGTEYLVFTSTYQTHGARWSVNSCSATTESSNDRTREAAVTVYGEPGPPNPGAASFAMDAWSTAGIWIKRNALLLWAVVAIAVAAPLVAIARDLRKQSRSQR
ncbi:hypothetical protein [Rhodococcus xishaensis]|uniref:Tissue inhibitor of metalloproteinase n=1 Tax=Rhodococcus xishaensis TaxID=2487364 RepID=A0A438ATE8_9NOCA|nr:hypothetical protein [Rhodococcus xishaensis]RVW01915.1 hypothetical protein EGT50_10655 [Rhodococcus xishaensis]